jgi:hypothetical protein
MTMITLIRATPEDRRSEAGDKPRVDEAKLAIDDVLRKQIARSQRSGLTRLHRVAGVAPQRAAAWRGIAEIRHGPVDDVEALRRRQRRGATLHAELGHELAELLDLRVVLGRQCREMNVRGGLRVRRGDRHGNRPVETNAERGALAETAGVDIMRRSIAPV